MSDNVKKTEKKRFVLVTTEFRGVFAGYAADTAGDIITLEDARCAIYWSSDVGGFMGLASTGPTKKCRIGAAADIELRKVTAVVKCTSGAEQAWISAETYKQ